MTNQSPRTEILVFEDDAIGKLNPAVHARPGYAITCASYRLIDWVKQLPFKLYGHVRPHLRVIQQADFALSEPPPDAFIHPTTLLLINARTIPSPRILPVLQQLLSEGRSQAIRDANGSLAAALVVGATSFADAQSQATQLPLSPLSLELFVWPHDLVSKHMRWMNESLAHRIAHGEYKQLQDGVFVRESAKLGDYAVIDTSKGPIILEEQVQVGPFCYLAGPVYVGPKTRVIEHAALKDAVSLGHTTKIGGEVEASVVEPYTNKQHHGFLGHSYLGSWINLGAGTCNSDLKNTYGNINMEYENEKVATEMQFMGCVMGDYSKTAINTGIFTGKVIGVCSMLYGFVTSNVPSYVTYARLFGQTSVLPPDVMISTQARMFARRKVEQRECDRRLIQDLFDLTESERASQTQLGL